MAKAKKPKIEIKEVETQKVDKRIPLHTIIEQLAEKAGTRARGLSSRSVARDRTARIKELSAELARELRALEESAPESKPASKKPKRR